MKRPLRTIREGQNLTQAELARRVGRTPAFVNFLERGRTRHPSYEDVTKIAAVLGCDPDDISFAPPRRRQAVA